VKGTVKSFDARKGYGFIHGEDGREYLVHFAAIKNASQVLREKVVVEFTPMETSKGPQAVEVSATETP
jgi:CspA family cold shock protein